MYLQKAERKMAEQEKQDLENSIISGIIDRKKSIKEYKEEIEQKKDRIIELEKEIVELDAGKTKCLEKSTGSAPTCSNGSITLGDLFKC